MPIYEYACTACGERVEARQSFTDPPLDTCEICSGKLRKLYSPVGIVFKGSGFYATDAKNNKKGSSGSSASSASSGGESGGDTKTESKPKTETKKQSDKSGSSSTKKETPKK